METPNGGSPSVSAEPRRDAADERLTALLVRDLDAGFAQVVRVHKGLLFTALLRACGDRRDAEDLTAEAFLRAYRALRGYDTERIRQMRLRPWLLAIALNAWRNLARDRSRRPRHVPLEQAPDRAAHGDQFERAAGRADDQRALAGMLASLPERQRVAVVLRHVCDLPASEVAEVLAVPEGTARSLVSRGLARLRDQVEAARKSGQAPALTGTEEGS